MAEAIAPADFVREVLEESRPVLLACLTRGPGLDDQRSLVAGVARGYAPGLKLCFMDDRQVQALRNLCAISGTPAFLLFWQGREWGRLLGRPEANGLNDFLRHSMARVAGADPVAGS